MEDIMSIIQTGNIITIRDDKGQLLKQFNCDCAEDAKRIAEKLKLKLGVKNDN